MVSSSSVRHVFQKMSETHRNAGHEGLSKGDRFDRVGVGGVIVVTGGGGCYYSGGGGCC